MEYKETQNSILFKNEYEEEFLKGLVEVYRSEFENIEYGSPKKITVEIKETADKRYSADLTDVLNVLVGFK